MPFDLSRALRAQENKAFVAHPAFMGTDPVSTYQPGYGGAARTDAKITQRNAGWHSQAYGGDQAIDWVFDAINMFSVPTAMAPYRLEKSDGTNLVRTKTAQTPKDHEVGPAALYALLDNPNPYMLYDHLMELMVIDLLLVGNAYWYKFRTNSGGQPLSLFRLAPSAVKIVPDVFGAKSYEYKPQGAKNPIVLDPEDIMHFRRPNPHDQYYGMGVIQGAGRAMDIDISLTDSVASYYENNAEPSLIIQSERRVPRDVFKKLAAQLRNKLAGSSKQGEMLLLEAGLTASTLSPKAADALFAAMTVLSRDRILAKFHLAPVLLGMMDEQSGSNKVSDFRREFDNYTLRPFMDKLQRVITDGLAAAYGAVYVIDHTYQSPPDEQIKVVQQVAATPGIKVREVRRLLAPFGIEESTGDNQIDEFVLNMPGPEADANGNIVDPVTGKTTSVAKANSADRPLAGEAGRPPKGENTRGFGSVGTKALMDDLQLRIDILSDKAAIQGKALTNPDGSKATIGNRLQGEIPPDLFAADRAQGIDDSMHLMQGALGEAAMLLERGLLDHVEGKAFNPSDLVARMRKSESWATFKDLVEQALIEGARKAAQSAGQHTSEADVDYDKIAESIAKRPEATRGIVRTLKERVAIRIKRALDKDAVTPQTINNEIQAVIRDWSNNQAAMIAETEAVHAYNETTLTVAEAQGLTEVYVTDGHDHDEACQAADGSVWSIDHARENRLEHPRCRRAFIALEPEVA